MDLAEDIGLHGDSSYGGEDELALPLNKVPQHTEESPLVIAIDYGTTCTGVALTLKSDVAMLKGIQVIQDWGSQIPTMQHMNIPPVVSYSPSTNTNDRQWAFNQGWVSIPVYAAESPCKGLIIDRLFAQAATRTRSQIHHKKDSNALKSLGGLLNLGMENRVYTKATNFKRKAVELFIKGKKCFARPDTGSDRNIITAAFAKEHSLDLQQKEQDKNAFITGDGQYTQSIGKALVPCRLLGGSSRSEESFWFHVMAKCSAPIIVGQEFIRKIQLFTKNAHLLVECPFSFGNFPSFNWIGSPKATMEFSADGQTLTAGVDTGSDLDLMSLSCAFKNAFDIDWSKRGYIMLADERIVETVGEVRIKSVKLPGFDDFEMTFQVLPDLVCDVIFGEEFLEQMDAFNTCDIVDADEDWDTYGLNLFVNLGPVQSFLSAVTNFKRNRRRRKETNMNDQELLLQTEHGVQIEEEMYHRHQADRLIAKIRDMHQAAIARGQEAERRRRFEHTHINCLHCVNGNDRNVLSLHDSNDPSGIT